MNDLHKTIAFVVAAAALAAAALFAVPRAKEPEAFNDQGQVFYPDFKDPGAATALEIVEYVEAAASVKAFNVVLKDNRWIIPSHHNYPADAKDRLAKTAASIIDLKRDSVRSDRTQDHEQFGVVDPRDDKVQSVKGVGRRVTLRDKDGKVLADFVIGRETKDGSGMRYMRLPGQKRVYAVKTRGDVSMKFEDWIETDLLKLTAAQIRRVRFDNYTLVVDDPDPIKNRSEYSLVRDDAVAPWKVSEMKDAEEAHSENVTSLVNALDDLKIVGVRPKPPALTEALKAGGAIRLTQEAVNSLASRGFFVTRRGDLLSNEGEIDVSCNDGVVYTLRFGAILVGSGEEVEAGTEEPKPPKDPKDPKTPKTEGKEHRYLFVMPRFDQDAAGKPPAAPDEVKIEDTMTPDQKKQAEEKNKAAKDEYERKKKDYEAKVAAGKKRAKELSERFADWYYVISAEYFKNLRRPRAELVRPKTEKPKLPDDPHKHD